MLLDAECFEISIEQAGPDQGVFIKINLPPLPSCVLVSFCRAVCSECVKEDSSKYACVCVCLLCIM